MIFSMLIHPETSNWNIKLVLCIYLTALIIFLKWEIESPAEYAYLKKGLKETRVYAEWIVTSTEKLTSSLFYFSWFISYKRDSF